MDKYERFFGLHFDFHAKNNVEIGKNTKSEDIEWFINETHPDYIQCDCKGTDGNSCYPTKVGKSADKLVADNLRVWVDTAKRNGLPIYVHFSGVWNPQYTKSHPEDAAMYKDGTLSERASVFGGYADKLVIPQIKELITEYDIDGVWIDADLYAVDLDFSDNAKPYLWDGITEEDHKKVMHDGYLRYAQKYVDELHKFKPGFKVIINWLYTAYAPDKPEIDVDFLSGDNSPLDSTNAARIEARCMCDRGKPWDIMAWTFGRTPWLADKSAPQLCQEVSFHIALGGGTQLYILQNPDGSAPARKSKVFAEVADFVHKRKINFKKHPIAQIGLYYSAETRYARSNIFNASGTTECLIGMLNCLLDAQYTVGVSMEYQIDEINKYETFIVPEWDLVSTENKEKLLAYAKGGGNLIITGAQACHDFGKILGFDFPLSDDNIRTMIMSDNGLFYSIPGAYADIGDGAENKIYTMRDIRYAKCSAYKTATHGKGKVTFIPVNIGSNYYLNQSYVVTEFMKKVLDSIMTPIIEINKRDIDITMQENGSGIYVNLINHRQNRHSTTFASFDEVEPICDIEITVRGKYTKAEMPFGEEFRYECFDGGIKIKLKQLDIHSIIALD